MIYHPHPEDRWQSGPIVSGSGLKEVCCLKSRHQQIIDISCHKILSHSSLSGFFFIVLLYRHLFLVGGVLPPTYTDTHCANIEGQRGGGLSEKVQTYMKGRWGPLPPSLHFLPPSQHQSVSIFECSSPSLSRWTQENTGTLLISCSTCSTAETHNNKHTNTYILYGIICQSGVYQLRAFFPHKCWVYSKIFVIIALESSTLIFSWHIVLHNKELRGCTFEGFFLISSSLRLFYSYENMLL